MNCSGETFLMSSLCVFSILIRTQFGLENIYTLYFLFYFLFFIRVNNIQMNPWWREPKRTAAARNAANRA